MCRRAPDFGVTIPRYAKAQASSSKRRQPDTGEQMPNPS
jgi:hypothetical protein